LLNLVVDGVIGVGLVVVVVVVVAVVEGVVAVVVVLITGSLQVEPVQPEAQPAGHVPFTKHPA